jgi:hypothetical protein
MMLSAGQPVASALIKRVGRCAARVRLAGVGAAFRAEHVRTFGQGQQISLFYGIDDLGCVDDHGLAAAASVKLDGLYQGPHRTVVLEHPQVARRLLTGEQLLPHQVDHTGFCAEPADPASARVEVRPAAHLLA